MISKKNQTITARENNVWNTVGEGFQEPTAGSDAKKKK